MEVNTRKVWPVDYRGAVVGAPMGCPDCGCRRAEKSEPVGKTGMDRRTCAHCGRVYQEKKQEEAAVSFRMCKYCGKRIVEAYGKWGRPMESGVYCSRDCAEAVHGFDNAMESDRRHRAAVVDLDAMPTPEPHGGDDGSLEKARLALDEMDRASAIDKRLPDILLRIKNGETQEQVAKRWGISQVAVHQLIKKFRASL